MNNELPITIKASHVLTAEFVKLASILNKHEAHFNFQTLAAGWYEDEDNILSVELLFVSIEEFEKQVTIENLGEITEISDDVLSYFDQNKNRITCFVAITLSETTLMLARPKLLSGYTKTKLAKVMNCLAMEHLKTKL